MRETEFKRLTTYSNMSELKQPDDDDEYEHTDNNSEDNNNLDPNPSNKQTASFLSPQMYTAPRAINKSNDYLRLQADKFRLDNQRRAQSNNKPTLPAKEALIQK